MKISFEPYDLVLSVLSFGGPPFAHEELLPVLDPYQVFRFEPMHHPHPGVAKRLLQLTAV